MAYIMRPVLCFIALTVSSVGLAAAEPYEVNWVRQYNLVDSERVTDVAADGLGGAYFVGTTGGTPIYHDAIIGHYDGAGTLLWLNQFSVAYGNTVPASVAADNDGNVYTLGTSDDSLLTVPRTFVRKFNSQGNLLWTTQTELDSANEFSRETPGRISVDALGNTFVTGSVDLVQGRTHFITMFNSAGELQWSNRELPGATSQVYHGSGGLRLIREHIVTSAGAPVAFGTLDSAGGVVFTYETQLAFTGVAASTFDEAGNLYVVGNLKTSSAFINTLSKFDSTGATLWTSATLPVARSQVHGIAISDGRILLFGGRNENGLLVTLDGRGELFSTKEYGTPEYDAFSNVVVDEAGNVFAGGFTHGDWARQIELDSTDGIVMKLSAPVPEPSSFIIVSFGIVALLGARCRS
jgi:hypothetical protein